jgi:hypothetical protein
MYALTPPTNPLFKSHQTPKQNKIPKKGKPVAEYDPEIYEDPEFYDFLVRDFVQSGVTDSAGG